MPIYEYKCNKCGHMFGLLQSFLAKRKGHACPECGSTETERVVSRFGSGKGDDSCSSRGPFT